MVIWTGTDPQSGQPTAIFTIAGNSTGAVVSVVGSFNDWTPGIHTLKPTDEGTLSVSVLVRPDADLHFRYLDSDGVWFDDPDSDAITEYGSFVAAPLRVDEPPTEPTGAADDGAPSGAAASQLDHGAVTEEAAAPADVPKSRGAVKRRG
jgi:hypothetical protein